ncbi:MAG: type 1 glutamine amidotransferase [Nostocoides sp.]
MRALVIKHDHVSPPGHVGDRLIERGYELDEHLVVEQDNYHRPHLHNPFPSLECADLVVSMGAPWSAYDEAGVGRWVAVELDLLRRADAQGIPVLGICFGGQLLAAAHGGTVEASAEAEIGWVDIDTDDPGLIPPGPWFQWHYDRFHVPPGGMEVARNAVTSQAFLLRRNLAVQFHPELFPGMLRGWLDTGGREQAIARDLDPEALIVQTEKIDAEARLRAAQLVDAFLDRVAVN